MRSSLMIPFLAVVLFAGVQGLDCPAEGTGMNPEDRDAILNRHNELRSSNARGLEPDGASGAMAPSGKNIYKLSYSCDLEEKAQRWADGCVFKHSPQEGRDAGENIYAVYPAQNSNAPLVSAANSWWSELKNKGVGQFSEDFLLTDDVFSAGAGHYTQMVWGETTEVGCGIAQCSSPKSMTYVVCNYRIAGNMDGSPIYEIGNPCEQDSDCTTITGSTCSVEEGLCVKP